MSKSEPIQTTGRRKTSVAAIRMQPGTGAIKVNGRDFTEYFVSISLQNQILRPLEIANGIHSYDLLVKTTGRNQWSSRRHAPRDQPRSSRSERRASHTTQSGRPPHT
jgi:ribosomal protein S9